MASRAHARRGVDRLAVRRGAGTQVVGRPGPGFAEPISVREAAALWRRTLADRAIPGAERLAALDGLVALGVDPRRWWFQRDWTDTGRPLHEHLRASYSKLDVLDNCELQFVLGYELGLGRPVGYQAWVGSLVHRIIEDCEKGAVERTLEGLVAEVDERWRPQEFPAKAVSEAWRALAQKTDAPQLVRTLRRPPRLGHGSGASSSTTTARRSSATSTGSDPTPPGSRDHASRTTRPAAPIARPKANESLQLGIYYLAVLESEELKEFQPVSGVELVLPQGRLAHRRARDARVDGGHARSRGGVPGRDAREALRPGRRAEAAERRRFVSSELPGELLLLRVPVALPAVPGGPAVVRRREPAGGDASDERHHDVPAGDPRRPRRASPRPRSSGARSRGRSSRTCSWPVPVRGRRR